MNPQEVPCNVFDFVDTTRVYFKFIFDERDTLLLLPSMLHASFDHNVPDAEIDSLFAEYDLKKKGSFSGVGPKRFLLIVPDGHRAEEFFTFYGTAAPCGFGNNDIITTAGPVFKAFPDLPNDPSVIMLGDEFIARVDTTRIRELEQLNREHNVIISEISDLRRNRFLMRVTRASDLNSLDIANLYQVQDFVEWAEPNLYGIFTR